MEFGLTEEQVLLQDSIGRYLADNAGLERARQFADGGEERATDVCAALAELGVSGLIIEESYGGVGLKMLDAAIVAEQLGANVTPVAFAANAVMVPLALQRAGSEAQKSHWLPLLAAGEVCAGAAVSEAIAAREDARISVSSGRLTGRALFVLDHAADVYLVADDRNKLHLVEAKAPGLTSTRLTTIDKTRHLGELRFDGVTADPLPGGDDPTVLANIIDAGRIVLAADTLGAAQNMLDQAVAYAGQRQQFGRVIASFQAVKHMCAEMAARLEPCRAMIWYAAHAFDAVPEESRLTACHTKAHLGEVGKFVAKTATEVHGGMGFTDLLGLHYWFKRIGFNRQLLGGPELVREEAARLQALS
jgi:alkylation response protein AidB-like acyl-CoA dehydrogenase